MSDTFITDAQIAVAHWEQRREVLAGKGMIVAMSRRIAVVLYNEIVRLSPDWDSDDPGQGRIKVVITGSAADDALLQRHIYPKETLRQIKNRAKDPDDPLELVIVRDMWLTGFDSPPMHTHDRRRIRYRRPHRLPKSHPLRQDRPATVLMLGSSRQTTEPAAAVQRSS